MLVIKIKK